MKNLNQEDWAYERAKHKVEKIKGFYKHLAVYLIVNAFLYGLKFVKDLNWNSSISEVSVEIHLGGMWFYWGIGVVIHGLIVFGAVHLFGKKWEEDRIKQFMEDEERSTDLKNREDGKL